MVKIDDYSEIMSVSVEEVLRSPHLTLLLLRLASKLLLYGGQPRGCEKSIRSYYRELKEQKNLIPFLIMKTCKLKDGVHFLSRANEHVVDYTMTDDKAIRLLKAGLIPENLFVKLPDGYKEIPAAPEKKPEAIKEAPKSKKATPKKKK